MKMRENGRAGLLEEFLFLLAFIFWIEHCINLPLSQKKHQL